MANTGNTPNFSGMTRRSAPHPLGPGSPPQKELRTTGGADLQDDQHQPVQQDRPLNAMEPVDGENRVRPESQKETNRNG